MVFDCIQPYSIRFTPFLAGVKLLIVPMVFHMLINRLGACPKCVWSCDHIVAHDHVDDQSLGRSCDTKGAEMSCDKTCDRSGDSFLGSHSLRVVCTI